MSAPKGFLSFAARKVKPGERAPVEFVKADIANRSRIESKRKAAAEREAEAWIAEVRARKSAR